MPEVEPRRAGSVLYVLIAIMTVAQAGCLLAIAGAAGGAAATGYFYCKGHIYHDYPASLPDVHNAVRASLMDLHFPLFTDEVKDGKAFLVTKMTNGKKVRIYLSCVSSLIPSDGVITRLGIRVATFGDESISDRIFKQVDFRLGHPAPMAPSPTPGGAPPIGAPVPIQPTSFQTHEPTIAPPK
jgi:hypothetical protein